MTTEDFITFLFCLVDDRLRDIRKHPQASLWPSELVTIGLLFVLKGVPFRAFYRWLARDYATLFAKFPERTRLQRLLKTHRAWCERFLGEATFFTVIDSYGVELIHPIREGRSPKQIGRKGKSNWRWIVGVKLCWLVNDQGERSWPGTGIPPTSMIKPSCLWWNHTSSAASCWAMSALLAPLGSLPI